MNYLGPKYIELITALFDLQGHMNPAPDSQSAVIERCSWPLARASRRSSQRAEASRLADLLRDGWCKYEELTDRTFCDSAISHRNRGGCG